MATREEHTQRGRHSNIPECCIRFFWVWLHAPTEYRTWHHSYYGYTEAHYKQCPDCHNTGKVNVLHGCTSACVGKVGACETDEMLLLRETKEIIEYEKSLESL